MDALPAPGWRAGWASLSISQEAQGQALKVAEEGGKSAERREVSEASSKHPENILSGEGDNMCKLTAQSSPWQLLL